MLFGCATRILFWAIGRFGGEFGVGVAGPLTWLCAGALPGDHCQIAELEPGSSGRIACKAGGFAGTLELSGAAAHASALALAPVLGGVLLKLTVASGLLLGIGRDVVRGGEGRRWFMGVPAHYLHAWRGRGSNVSPGLAAHDVVDQ